MKICILGKHFILVQYKHSTTECMDELNKNMILHNLEDIQLNSPPQCAKDYVPKRSIWIVTGI